MFTKPKTQRFIESRVWCFHLVVLRLTLAAVSVLALAGAGGVLAASITLGWTPPANTDQIDGYQLHYGLTSGQYQSVKDVSGAASSSTTVDGLTPGTKYYLALRSRNQDASLVSAFSNEVSTTISAPDTVAPVVSAIGASPTGPYTVAQTVAVSATASDNVAVTRVDFYDGSTLKGSDTSAPYSVAWSVTSAANGSHTWTAKAYDAANNVGTSAALGLAALTFRIRGHRRARRLAISASPSRSRVQPSRRPSPFAATASDNVARDARRLLRRQHPERLGHHRALQRRLVGHQRRQRQPHLDRQGLRRRQQCRHLRRLGA